MIAYKLLRSLVVPRTACLRSYSFSTLTETEFMRQAIDCVKNNQDFLQNLTTTVSPDNLTIPVNKKLPLVLTAHPCGAIPATNIGSTAQIYDDLHKTFEQITIHEEVETHHYFFRQYWQAAPYIDKKINPVLKSWVAKECDRSPNQPPVIKYGVAMDHLYMLCNLYLPSMNKLGLVGNDIEHHITAIEQYAHELKRLAKIEAALTAVEYPGTYFADHLLDQFFTKYSPESYIAKNNHPNLQETTRDSALQIYKLEHHSKLLEKILRDKTECEDHANFRKFEMRMNLLPLWGMQTQGRLPAEDVTNTTLEILQANGHDVQDSNNLRELLMQTISSLREGNTYHNKGISPESLNVLMFYRLFNNLGSRMSEVVLANYRNHIDFICSHILAKITAPYAQRHVPGMILAEDTYVLRNMAKDLEELYTIPYFNSLSQKEGISIFIARSDTTRCAGVSANTEVLASVKETVDTIAALYDDNCPNLQLILGQGSSPHRGLYNNTDQYYLPFSHPMLSCGVTTQPGPGQYRIANHNIITGTLAQLSLMNATSPEQQMREKMMTPEYIKFMRELELPGELYFRKLISNPISWINRAFQDSKYSQNVLDRIHGSRWKQQYVGDIELFNKQRAITVFAITKELGFPVHTIVPFVESLRAFLISGSHFDNCKLYMLAELYNNNINYRDHLSKIDECILDSSMDIAGRQGLGPEVVTEMKSLYNASLFYLRKISGNKLPSNNRLTKLKKRSHEVRLLARDRLPRYSAIDTSFTNS